MTDTIRLVVGNVNTVIDTKLPKSTMDSIKKVVGYRDEQAEWKMRAIENKLKAEGKPHFWVRQKMGDGIVSCIIYDKEKKKYVFPSGLLSNVKTFLKECNLAYELVDERSQPAQIKGYNLSPEISLRDYQSKAVEKSVKQTRGIVRAATGSGKTAIASAIIADVGAVPSIFYVTSIDLMRQAKDEIEKFIRYNNKPIKVGQVGAGKFDLQDITVMTVQTAVRALGHKYTKYDDEDFDDHKYNISTTQGQKLQQFIKSAGAIYCDEVHHWCAKTCQIIASSSEFAKYRYGFSATPFRDQGDDMLIDACFGKVICDIKASDLIRKKYLVRPTIYFVHTPKKNVEGSYDRVYKDGIINNQDRNLLISNIAEEMKKRDRKILILIKNIEHGNILESLIPDSFFLHGSHKAEERNKWIDKMREGEASITISTSLFDEGVDIKPLNALILAGSGASKTRALQRIGRVIRPYSNGNYVKDDAIVVDFVDNIKYMRKQSNTRRKIYKTEPEFEIRDWKI